METDAEIIAAMRALLAKRTKTPWRARKTGDYRHVISRIDASYPDTDMEAIIGGCGGDGNNARAIVAAVNTHSALLDVLEAAAAPAARHECAPEDGGCQFCNAIGNALDVLRAEVER